MKKLTATKIKIGDIVTVTVTRPLGSYHPEHKGMYYPVNCGCADRGCTEGGEAADGEVADGAALGKEEPDTYILGVNEPVQEFTGEVIGIVCREDDDGDAGCRYIVASEKMHYTAEQVMHWIKFAEKYYKSRIVMKLYGFDIDPEALDALGFRARADRDRYYLSMDQTPSVEQVRGLLKLLSGKEELMFWNYYHRRNSDPGAYATVHVVDGKAIIREGNHGWSGLYHRIDMDDLVELILRNWDKDWDRQQNYNHAVALEKTTNPKLILAQMEKKMDVFTPDYSATPW